MNNHSFTDIVTDNHLTGIQVSQPSRKYQDASEPADKPEGTKRRTAPKRVRKEQLIKATIRSIAKHGLSVTTMASVASEAGLSQGIINLHFQSKDRLLEETLRYVADEYRQVWLQALEDTDASASDKLKALVEVDFDKRICQRNKLAVWFAFWGESRSRPVYRQICADHNKDYRQVVSGLCQDIIDQGDYKVEAHVVVYGLSAINEGLWLDLLLNSPKMTPELGFSISMAWLKGIFPKHF